MNSVINLSRKTVNIETNIKCTLQCPSCKRTDFKNKYGQNVPLPGGELTLEDLEKCIKYFKGGISFCGQHSDPIFGVHFIDMLKMCKEHNVRCDVHTAATGRNKEWYKEAFLANTDAEWWFGIDGPPHLSNTYRVNQKGEHLFEMMCYAKELGLKKIIWKYIIFNYNEDYVEECKELANKKGIRIDFIIPSRSLPEYLLPTKAEYKWRNYV